MHLYKIISSIVRIALFGLFAYAALMKYLGHLKFMIELAKSPFINEILILPISYLLPAVELVLSLCLVFKRTKMVGLYAAFGLMLLFTLYLLALVMLPASETIPCACGGILGGMSYPVHIAFNIAFTLIALVGIYTSEHDSKRDTVLNQQTI